jgi:hypothetical protein
MAIDYQHVLKEYREIWNNRKLESDEHPEMTLVEAITRELNDENTHPRARRPLMEKYYLATKRIMESSISLQNKAMLITIHIEVTEKIKQERD